MSNRTLLAAELARRIPDLQADALVNNEALIKGMIEQYLGPEFKINPAWEALERIHVGPPPVRTDYARSPYEVGLPLNDADWLNGPVPMPTFER